MSGDVYNMNGYPEPEHIYLGKSNIMMFTIFPDIQMSQTTETLFNPEEPVYYSVEWRGPLSQNTQYGQYLTLGCTIEKARERCAIYIKAWCDKNGLQLK